MKKLFPTGVESHGGFLRVWFMLNGKRHREPLGVPDTPKNRKKAGEFRQSVCYAIRTGTFNYSEQFPDSAKSTGPAKKEITLAALIKKWLIVKKTEISENTLGRYKSKLKTVETILGEDRVVSSIRGEDMLLLRNELLTGQQLIGKGHKKSKKGRAVVTVNSYMDGLSAVLEFAFLNGYTQLDAGANLTPLRKSRKPPDPLLKDEFIRVIESCQNWQIANLWSFAVYTGLRHGELCALSWEDIDMMAGTAMVRRNLTSVPNFTLPKTQAGTDRVIQLIEPALQILRAQAAMTRMSRQTEVTVSLREYGRTRQDACTFVFNPQLTAIHAQDNTYYAVSSLGQTWDAALRKSGVRRRKAYQSRHTYACWSIAAGANPSFIAAQMGHASAQMVYTVYGDWMPENNDEQVTLLNQKLSSFAPSMPHRGIA